MTSMSSNPLQSLLVSRDRDIKLSDNGLSGRSAVTAQELRRTTILQNEKTQRHALIKLK